MRRLLKWRPPAHEAQAYLAGALVVLLLGLVVDLEREASICTAFIVSVIVYYGQQILRILARLEGRR